MGTLMKDVMLDVETLGTKSTAAIIQIGACYFDRETGEIGDKFKSGSKHMSEVDFRVRIGKAMRRGDVDDIGDAASPFVTQAASKARRHFEFIKKQAEDVRLFEAEIQKALDKAKASGDTVMIKNLTRQLEKVRSEGVSVNTAISYLPRIYRIDRKFTKRQTLQVFIRG